MWICVDRIESGVAVLLDDEGAVYTLPAVRFEELAGRPAAESDVLRAEARDGEIVRLTYDGDETRIRKARARERLDRLFGRSGR